MLNLALNRVRWLLLIAAGFVLLIVVLVGLRLLNRDRDGLDEIRKESVYQLSYPQATSLGRSETPKQSNFLEGTKFGAQTLYTYGVNASDQQAEAFYRQKLEESGWKLAGTATSSLNTYRQVVYDKGRLRTEIRFWYREDFQSQYPSINIDGFATIYDLLIFGPPD